MQGQAGGGGGVVAAFLVGQGLTATKPGMEPAPQNADPPPPPPRELGRYKEANTFQSKGTYNKTPIG